MKIQNKKLRLNFILIICIIASTLFLSIGYAALNPITLDIQGIASAIGQEGVYITALKLADSKNIDQDNTKIINAYQTMMQSNIALSPYTTDTYVKYEITIYNSTNENYCFCETNYETCYTNENISFELEGLQEGDFINAGGYKTFYITFKYNTDTVPSENTLESYIDFVFKKAHRVTYENITNNNYKSYAIDGETFTVAFGTLDAPIEIKINGNVLNSGAYTYNNYTLSIPNVNGDIHIRKLTKYTITNLVKNGSFENNLTSWSMNPGGSSNYWASTTVAKFGSKSYYRKPSGSIKNYILQSITWTQNHQYYYFVYGYCTTQQSLYCDVTNKGGSIKLSVGNSQWTKGGTIYKSSFSGSNTISINYAESTGYIYVDGIGIVDLTVTFGAGNEPDLNWCNANINYFDTTATVYK